MNNKQRYAMVVVAAAVVFLSACSSTPSSPTQWVNLGWANTPVQQAEAECYNFINSAAGWGSNLYLCMKAKGWEER